MSKTAATDASDPITVDIIRATLRANRESDEPDAILAVLKEHNGKPLTSHILAKLPGGAERWHIRKGVSMTHIEERTYRRSDGRHGMSFLISYATRPIIDTDLIETQNSCYFAGRRDRNVKRDLTLLSKNAAGLQEWLAQKLNAVKVAREELAYAERDLEELIGFDAAFSPDSSTWQKLAGKE